MICTQKYFTYSSAARIMVVGEEGGGADIARGENYDCSQVAGRPYPYGGQHELELR